MQIETASHDSSSTPPQNLSRTVPDASQSLTDSLEQSIPSPRHVYLAIASAAMLTFLCTFTNKATNVMYPFITQSFHQPLNIIQWVTTAYMLANTVSITTTAYLLRRFPARTVERAAAVLFLIGTFLCAPATNLAVLFTGRMLQGLADGLCVAVMFFLGFTQVPKKKLGAITGVSGTVMALGCALGPTYGGWLCDVLSWRTVFWSSLPVALLSLVIGEIAIRNEPVGNAHTFSYLALMLLTAAFFLLDITATTIGSDGFGWLFWVTLLAGLVCAAGFIVANNTGHARLFNLEVFNVPPIRWATLNYFLMQIIASGIIAAIPSYAEYVLHANGLVAGFLLLPGALCGSVVSTFAGHWADKQGSRVPVLSGALLGLTGAVTLAVLLPWINVWGLLGLYIVSRASYNLMYTNTISHASTLVPPTHASDINSIFNTAENFGGSVGVDLFMSIFAFSQRSGAGMRTGGTIVFLLIVLCSAAMVICVLLTYTRNTKTRLAGR